jgi:hypothetical protein
MYPSTQVIPGNGKADIEAKEATEPKAPQPENLCSLKVTMKTWAHKEAHQDGKTIGEVVSLCEQPRE